MDVFALQEELDSVRVQRRPRRDERPSQRKGPGSGPLGDGGGVEDSRGPAAADNSSFALPDGDQQGVTSGLTIITDSFALPTANISESEIMACLHPQSAEYALRSKYMIFMHQIIGKGAYGEVVLGKLKDHQLASPSANALSPSQSMSSFGFSPTSSPHQSSSDSSQLFAIKRIDKRRINQKSLSQLYGEVETLSLLSHSNVVRLQEVFQDDDFLWIVMEYVRGGELGKVVKRVGRLTEGVARKVAMSLLLAIEYIHEKGIVHRDLKPANCLLTKLPAFMREDAGSPLGGSVASPLRASSDPKGRRNRPEDFSEDDYSSLKIADFGFAAMVGRAECLTNFCGTQHYMAPEVIRRDGLNYGKAVDVWSFGVILYLILSGDFPFSTPEQICQGKVQFASTESNDHIWARISPQAKDFVMRLLVVDPTKRLTATEALRHPWIKFEYSDSEEVSDYPTTKGIWRTHSKWIKTRKFEHRFPGAAHAVVFAHRLVFLARLQAMRREGIADISLLRHFPYIVHGVFEPANHIASSGRRFVGNVAALRRLADMVNASQTVEVFDVSNCSIDDLGLVQHIVKVAYTHPSLVCLNLENNPIPPLAGRAIIRLARSLTHKLNVINVNNTNLGYETISQVDLCLKETIRKRAEAALSPSGASSGTFAASISLHSSMSRESVYSPSERSRARTMSPQHSVDERHIGSNRTIFHNNSAASPSPTLRHSEMLSTDGLRGSPNLLLPTRQATPNSQTTHPQGRPQQSRRSQLPPLLELDLRARGAATNAVRQQRSSGGTPSAKPS